MVIVPPLTASDLSIFQQGQAEGALAMAAAVAVGGTNWTHSRPDPDADERTDRPEDETLGTLTGYLYRARPTGVAAIAAPDFVPTEAWRWIASGSPDVREDDALVSVADSTLSVTVRSVEKRSGYTVANVE